MGHVTGGPASQPTRGAGMTTLTFTTLTFPEINQAPTSKLMSLAFLQSEHGKEFLFALESFFYIKTEQ